MIKIETWSDLTTQIYRDGQARYVINNLIAKAKDLPIKEMPLEHLNIYGLGFDSDNIRKFVSNMKAVNESDLQYPIILDEDGYVMDGRHRIAKALLEGKETIKFVRFDKTPAPDYIEKEETE